MSEDKPLPRYTYSDEEGPECPFCGAEWTADDPIYFDEKGFEDDCPDCGNHIRIQPETWTAWRTTAVAWKDKPSPAQ